MKRFFAALLVLVMALSLCACKKSHAPKFVGTWADDTYNYTLTLLEDGSAVLKMGDTVYSNAFLSWEAEDYDSVVLKLDLAKYDFAMNSSKPATTPTTGTEGTEGTESTTPEGTTPEGTEGTESTAPEATAPEATAPESTAPEATAPEATAPEATAPEATAPEATAPEATAPEATAPEATAPEATAPEATAPEATAPEATAPEATAPEGTAPEGTEPSEDKEDESTEPTKRKGVIVIARLTLSISNGKMFLSLTEDGSKKAIAVLVKLS